MELLQYRVKKPQVTTKNCRTEPRSPGIPQNWTTLIPGGEISGILLSQKRFLSIKIKHRQSQTMFGWTTRFYEAMIKKQIRSLNICLLFYFCVAFFIFITHLTLSNCINFSPFMPKSVVNTFADAK
jgi:hypothetical protein